MGEKRKNYPKLVRDPYEFGADKNKINIHDQEMIVSKCGCSGTSPSLDSTPGTCFVDEYSICGSRGADGVDFDDPPHYYLRVPSGLEPNPTVIFVPGFGADGACFRKEDDPIACSAATGPLLGMEQYTVVPDPAATPACENPPCVDDSCPLMIFQICENDPAAATVSPAEIVVRSPFFAGFFGNKTVRYNGHCYTTPSEPCLSELYPGAVVPDFADLTEIETGGCESDSCACCSDVMALMDFFRDAIVERLESINFGGLPGGIDVDHDWDNPDYILNADSVETAAFDSYSNDESTACQDRYMVWQKWLQELDYWLIILHSPFSTVNSQIFGFLNTDTFPTGTIEGLAHATTIDRWNFGDYASLMQSSPCLTWYKLPFLGPNSDGEIYTDGGPNPDTGQPVGGNCEGGLGTVDVTRFGDTLRHVVVNDGNSAWCDLINATLTRMIEAIQRLTIQVLIPTVVEKSTKGTRDTGVTDGVNYFCAAAISCVVANHGGAAFGTDRTFEKCVLFSSGSGPGQFSSRGVGVVTFTEHFESGGETDDSAEAQSERAKLQANLIAFDPSLATVRVYLALSDLPSTYPGYAFGHNRPVTGFEVWSEWTGHGVVGGSSTAKSVFVTGTEDNPTDFGTCGGAGVIWQMVGEVLLVETPYII